MKIQFRIWDTENKCWFEPVFQANQGKLSELLMSPCGDLSLRSIDRMAHESTFPDKYIVTLGSGCEDKNNKQIFVGDIIKAHGNGFERPVTFENGCFTWMGEPLAWDFDNGDDKPSVCPTNIWAEIVGNIYENPELLTARKP